MAVAPGPSLAAVLLLVSSGLHCSSPLLVCPEPCTCQRPPLLNCSSSGLSLVPQHIQDSVSELDLSHNLLESVTLDQPHHNLRNVWLGNNNIRHLSLCVEANSGGRHVGGIRLHHLRRRIGQGCVSWAPTLQLLSAERNQLEQLPEGLENCEALQVLQLSFNNISTLRPGDFSRLRQLRELHLQHNHITSLHPQMFQDLAQLQVLDLSFNMLTSLHPLMYVSLRNIGANVGLGGNRWQCDCSMRSLRRRMAYDSSRGLQDWSVVCASPSIISGRDLLQLEEDDLNCFRTENGPDLHQDVTVHSGSEILLSCSSEDSMWWTSNGQASVKPRQAGLLISDFREGDTGLYVCVSGEHEVVSVFNLQISKRASAGRQTRSLPRTSRQIPQDIPNTTDQERNAQTTQSDLALAVCLSILFTFLIAFILGVIARPCVDVLWKRVTKKEKSSPETNSVSSVEQRQYDNEAFAGGEEPEERGTHRERRVTFSTVEYSENNNVQYYDTVANDQESINNDVVIECEAAKTVKNRHTDGDSGSENNSQHSSQEENQEDGRDFTGDSDTSRTHNMEFERIPDPSELGNIRRLSSSSDSSLSDKVFIEKQNTHKDCARPTSPHLAKDSVQQGADFLIERKVEVSQTSLDSNEVPEFSSEPFADWSPHANNPDLTDPGLWQDSGEQFEFSDSVRSTSARSSGVFNDSDTIGVDLSDKHQRDDVSCSSSDVSEDELTEYTVNSEEDIDRNHNKPEVTDAWLKQDAGFQEQIHEVGPIRLSQEINQGDYRYETQGQTVRPKHSSSSHSSDSDGEINRVKPENEKVEERDKSVCESDKIGSSTVTGEWDTRKKVEPMPRTKWRVPIVDTGAPAPRPAYSSSSSESEEEITNQKVKNAGRVNEGIKINMQETPSTDLNPKRIPRVKRRLNISAPLPASHSTSSDESTDEKPKYTMRQEHTEADMAGLPTKEYQSASHDTMKPQWSSPAQGLDNRASPPPTDSSSRSESADESMDQRKKQVETHVTSLQFQESPSVSQDPQTQWPVLDLEHISRIKRRLDIKAPLPAIGSSSSSDSEEEMHGLKEKHGANTAGLQFQESQTKSHARDTQWPVLDLEQTTSIKRRLDIKAPSPATDSSSSSGSEDETSSQVKKLQQETTNMAIPPVQASQKESHDPQTQWPVLDLEQTTRIKRRLDIKAPSPATDSSSSSNSDDETSSHIRKHGQTEVHMPGPTVQISQTGSHNLNTQWPLLDLERTAHIKRRLDIKGPSPTTDSSSSSDSEDETSSQLKKLEQEKTNMAIPPTKISQKESHDPQTHWPVLDLEQTTRIKRRLDIKAPSPVSDSSSSSNSEDETSSHIKKHVQTEVHMPGPTVQICQTGIHNLNTQWPLLDLERTAHIKRRLDIKAPSPTTDSSSSSDSEDETPSQLKKLEQEKTNMAIPPTKISQKESHDPQTQWPVLDLERTAHIKRRLDIKAPSPTTDSSSNSDSEDERKGHEEKLRPGKVDFGVRFQESPKESHAQQIQWPALDLVDTIRVKRRLDIKAPLPVSDSSSSSDSEDETSSQIRKPEQGKINMAISPINASQKESHDPQTQWPVLDLGQTTRIKRRLDIKAPSPATDSSSSSDSEDETSSQVKKLQQEKTNMAIPPIKTSLKESHDPQTQWPVLNLGQTTRIKRRLDIKAPLPAIDSSSGSDSEDETISHIKKHVQSEANVASPTVNISQTGSHNLNTHWPLLDLERTTHIKRRLDIKGPSPTTDSSSSSDSEDERKGHKEKQRPGNVDMAGLQFQESPKESHTKQIQWPALDLEHTTRLKRRLDIKAPLPVSDSSSGSDIEDETSSQVKKPEQGKTNMTIPPFKASQKESHDPQTQWPVLDLGQTTHIKRRLDIKAPSPATDSSSSSDNEDETISHINKHEQSEAHVVRPTVNIPQTGSHEPQTQWPLLDLEQTASIKRRLDIKAPSRTTSSSSSNDSEDETSSQVKKLEQRKTNMVIPPTKVSQKESYDPQTQWPLLDLEQTASIKRRLDIKAPSPATDSSSSDSEDERKGHKEKQWPGKVDTTGLQFQESQKESHAKQIQWPVLDLEKTTHIKRRLDMKAPLPATVSSSSSDSEGETTINVKRTVNSKATLQQVESSSSNSDNESQKVSATTTKKEFSWSPNTSVMHTSQSSKADINIQLNKYTVISDDMGDKTTNTNTTPEINPELESRWASMNLGFSRFRKRLEITPHTQEPPNLPSSPPPDSPSSRNRRIKIGDGKQGISHTTSSEEESRVQVQREASSGSSSENETTDRNVPDLKLGVPRIKRRLNVKAPSPEPSDSPSTSSENENDVTGYSVNRSGHASATSAMTESNSPVTYRRLIFQASSPLSNPSSDGGPSVDHTHHRHTVAENPSNLMGARDASLSPRRVQSMSLENIVKKRLEQSRRHTDVDLPPEIRWTGVGRQLPDFPNSSPSRTPDVVSLLGPQQGTPSVPELPPLDSFKYSSRKSDPDSGKTDGKLMYTSQPIINSTSSSTNEILRTVSEDRRERRGLSALKAMSSERRKWDIQVENLDEGASPFYDHGTQADTSYKYRMSEVDIKPNLSSSSVDERRTIDLGYGVPLYRRHGFGGTEPPDDAPPPIPSTPLPDEAVELSWQSPQSSTKQRWEGTRQYLLQGRKREEPDPSPQNLSDYFDSPNISHV